MSGGLGGSASPEGSGAFVGSPSASYRSIVASQEGRHSCQRGLGWGATPVSNTSTVFLEVGGIDRTGALITMGTVHRKHEQIDLGVELDEFAFTDSDG